MKTLQTLLVLLVLLIVPSASRAQPPYPIIFVHGLTGSDTSFQTALRHLGGYESTTNWGDYINVFDVVLNADCDDATALLSTDVKWEDFTYSGDLIRLGRRSWNPLLGADSPGNYVHEWSVNSALFAVNFQEERIEGAHHLLNDLFDFSNSAAIYKQGYALKIIIQEVLDFTGADKVILVGHSMGGLAIREYLQRVEGSTRRWWQDQSDAGHRVAKVVTIGTPHLGSNEWNVRREEGWPNPNSEAVRDLRYRYGTWIPYPPNYETDNGVYLFGGSESWLSGEAGFHNYDINCDGDETDNIIGINDPFANGEYNPLMYLPSNIEYTWIISDNGSGDDGVVRTDRQWLYNIGETLPINVAHEDEPDDIPTVIRGLDEPDVRVLAYAIETSDEIQGFITIQPNEALQDTDVYAFSIGQYSDFTVTVDGVGSGVHAVEIVDEDELIAGSTIAFVPSELSVALVPGNYYVRIAGVGTTTTWEHPYTITTSSAVIPLYADFSAAPTSGEIPLTVIFTDESIGTITGWAWDFDNDGNMDSFEQNPSHTYDEAGTYTVSLTITDWVWQNTETRIEYIQVNQPPVPLMSVSDLTIQPVGDGRVELSWSPVTEDVEGNPVTVVYYELHASDDCSFVPSPETLHSVVPSSVLSTYIYSDELCFNVVAVTGNEFVLQPRRGAGKDIWTTSLYSFAPGGGGPGGGLDNHELRVGGWGDYYYSLLQFDLTGLPISASEVELRLYSVNPPPTWYPTSMYLDRITEDWDWERDDRLWWENRPSSTQWNTDVLPEPDRNAWYTINITDLYNSWKSGTYPNYGLQLRPTSNWDNFNLFYSSDYLEDPSLRPYLRIIP